MTDGTTMIGYVKIGNETVMEVGIFTILWNLFENAKCDYNCSADKISSMEECLESLAKEPFELLARVLKGRTGSLCSIENYVATRIYPKNNAKITKVDRDSHIPMVVEFIKSNGQSSLVGGLLAIYRIRNNMFHGLKGHSELDEQIELFRSMSAVLKEIVK